MSSNVPKTNNINMTIVIFSHEKESGPNGKKIQILRKVAVY